VVDVMKKKRGRGIEEKCDEWRTKEERGTAKT
jgi:hypothetical protein